MIFGDPILEPRFWAKVQVEPAGCWTWIGARNSQGYGYYKIRGRFYSAHRVAHEAFNTWIPEGMQIDHLCRNPPCVNPAHLEVVTPAENTRRGNVGALERARTHCPQGHPYDEANTRLKKNVARKNVVSRQCRACDAERHRQARARLSR